ncbi:cytochrome P450 [Rhizophagus clarus]|uniref:Cytochrome P450 n=1 Tax=Rhizophagus clarus TaxID=94130 RepID=A0A8H3QF16_9GLOM|nr:cytochrome P450 [Rhizophagus clarus]
MTGYFNELSENEKAERPSALIDETVKFVRAIRKYFMANYKEVMRPMTDLEMCGIIFDGIIAGTDIVIIFLVLFPIFQ